MDDPIRTPLLLSIPLKQAESQTWTPAILKYIETSYAEDAEKYQQDSLLFDSLREHAINQLTHDAFALEDLSIYYNQLCFFGSRFPIDINLDIGWCPLFRPQDRPEIISNLNYEKACVLYRIAGIYSELGCSQSWISTEGIRKACQFFQNAAGCLKHIKTDLLPDLRATPPRDFQLIDAMIALMMAQAHECIWQKAVMEHMKHGTVARLAIKVADFYDTFLQQSTPYIPEHWLRYAESKSNYFTAVAQYQKANEAISSGRYGEEIARLHLAKFSNAIATAHIRSDQQLLHPNLNEQILALEHAIERDLVRAEKDNDVVYMETIPEPNQLAPILRSDMVKPIIPNFVSNPDYWLVLKDRPNDPFFIKKPLFEKLVPFAVHQAVSVYSDKKDYIVQIEITAKIQQLTEEREKVLEELRLPYSLDIVDALPKKLVDCAEEVQHEGGIQSLHDMLQKIQTMSQKTLNLIEEGFNALEEENEHDAVMSRQYGKLWNRPNSGSLTHNLLTLGTQYNDTVQAAQKADRIVQAKVNNWGKAIAMLSRPASEIQAHLPHIQQDDPQYASLTELLAQLRDRLQKLETDAAQSLAMQHHLTVFAESDDISHTLLVKANELTKGSPIVKLEPEQFSAEFELHLSAYQPYQDQIKQHIHTQADLLNAIQDLYAQFSLLVVNKSVLVKREKAITNLESAFIKFKEIRTNLVEGIKFYSNYTDTLNQFRDDCVEFTLARQLEATELARDTNPSRLLLLKK